MSGYRPFEDMCSIDPARETAVLWAINRYLFHPRGFALAFVIDDGKVVGWEVIGHGDEVWTFSTEDDDDGFAKFEAFLDAHRRAEQ